MTITMESGSARSRAPWHLWVVGLVGLLWNGFGAYDYLMTNIQGDAYMRSMGMTDAQIAYMGAMPAWMTAVWAVGVWGAVAGTILLLMRSRWSVHVYAVSLAALLVSLVYAYALSDGARVMGQMGMIMNLVVTAGAVFFLWYAWTMRRRGALR
jgi:hypothetical protein